MIFKLREVLCLVTDAIAILGKVGKADFQLCRKRLDCSVKLSDFLAKRRCEAMLAYEQRQAHEQTPEGRQEVAERDALSAKMREADERFAIENPEDPFQEGSDAAITGDPREPPDELDETASILWLNGYDSQAPGEDE
jgi:hypothetical protein